MSLHPGVTRRELLQSSSALVGASLLPSSKRTGATLSRRGDLLRIALVGCGGRGTAPASEALATEGPVHLVALADAFRDRLEQSLAELARHAPERLDVPESRRFVGFDAYRRAIDLDVDVVILASPPGFRPLHFEHAVASGKHVFMEKPVAVDAPGVRKVLAAGALAAEKNLKVGVGLQRRHDPRYVETIERIREGAVGKVQLLRCYWNGTRPWVRPRESGWTEMEYQMRNWYYFNWLCGDHIVEQHIHNLDVCNWIMDATPLSAQGQGGRQLRDDPDQGEIFDHHAVEYTYADGTKMFSQCRQIPGCWESVSEHATGTEGTAEISAARIQSPGGWEWSWRGEGVDPYQAEQHALFAAVRADLPHNESERGALATLTAILGRMASTSGRIVTWEEALASEVDLAPRSYAWDAAPPVLPDARGFYPIAIPGSARAL